VIVQTAITLFRLQERKQMTTNQIVIAARKNLGGTMESSARLCLADAVAAYDRGDMDSARRWAIKSLAYSVGIFHADYQRAAASSDYPRTTDAVL
jgi:hypothetical protein